MRPRSKAAREAAVILGRDAVERAMANREAVTSYLHQNPGAVRAAIRGILAHLPDDVPAAVAFAATLPAELRTAIAGAWADRAAARLLNVMGLEETDDTPPGR